MPEKMYTEEELGKKGYKYKLIQPKTEWFENHPTSIWRIFDHNKPQPFKVARKVEPDKDLNWKEADPNWGVVIYYMGGIYPEKGFPTPELLFSLNATKKMLLAGIDYVTASPQRYFLPFLFLLPPRILDGLIYHAIYNFTRVSTWILSKHYLKPELLSPVAREIRRAGLTMTFKSNNRWFKLLASKKIYGSWYDALMYVVTVVQGDNSYRYRLQDILGEINKYELKRKPIRELLRLMDILIEREAKTAAEKQGKLLYGSIGKYKRIKLLLRILLFLKPKFKRFIRDFLLELDTEQVKLDEGDWYHCLVRPSYNYGGKTFQERAEEFQKNLAKEQELLKQHEIDKLPK